MARLTVTDVRIRRLSQDGKMKAVCSVTFDDAFVVHDVKVVEGQNGLFVAMPSRRTLPGNSGTSLIRSRREREVIQSAVLKAYSEAV